MVHLKINNIPVEVPEGSTILEAAKAVGINIPTLCYLKDINEIGACRICVCEVKGARSLVAACVYPVKRGHGGVHQYRKGAQEPQNDARAAPF